MLKESVMGSIPNLCWISRTGECFSCDAFRIEAEDSVKSALYRGLSLLPEGKNGVPLRLIQKAAVTEEEGYRLVLTPEGILLERLRTGPALRAFGAETSSLSRRGKAALR